MVRASHLRKSYVSRYVADNGEHGQQKVELDAVGNVTLASLLRRRLSQLVDTDIIDDSSKESRAAVKRWRAQHKFRRE